MLFRENSVKQEISGHFRHFPYAGQPSFRHRVWALAVISDSHPKKATAGNLRWWLHFYDLLQVFG